jgi:hypothetical protein
VHAPPKKLERAVSQGQKIVIDLQFENIMDAREINSLAVQLSVCYGRVKKMDNPFHLIFTSFKDGGDLTEAVPPLPPPPRSTHLTDVLRNSF